MKVLGFDPGGTTGWCGFVLSRNVRPRLVAADQFTDIQEVTRIIQPGIDLVVCESFFLFANKAMDQVGSQMVAPQLIGAIQLTCANLDIRLVMQPPGNKQFFFNRRLRDYGYIPDKFRGDLKKWRHSLDAIRHVLYYAHFTLGLRVKP